MPKMDINTPKTFAKNTNKSPVINEYASHPTVFPSMNAHGVGFKPANFPAFTAACKDLIGAANARFDRIAPMVGQTYLSTINAVDDIMAVVRS
eukprot:CCRYP_018359-RB/>CCRYP_018359-RB protein AED:0.45 eAED:1.00 QI:0/0/0/1/0/0/2/0/92